MSPSLQGCLLAALLAAGCAGPEPQPVRAQPAPASRPVEAGPRTRPSEQGPSYVRLGPKAISALEAGIGKQIPLSLVARDLKGGQRTLASLLRERRALIVVFTCTGCPVTRAYAPLLEGLARSWRKAGAAVLAIDPALPDSEVRLRPWVTQQGWTFPVARDPDYAWSDALGARGTADAFLLDATGKLRYRGPIDDRIGINYQLKKPRREHLSEALRALLAGKTFAQPAWSAPGCRLTRIRLEEED